MFAALANEIRNLSVPVDGPALVELIAGLDGNLDDHR
jgi:hypothetical protein